MKYNAFMIWNEEIIKNLVDQQNAFFKTDVTLPISWRKKQLKKLYESILKYQKELEHALYLDLGRSDTEAFFLDIGMVLMEIKECIKGLNKWSKTENLFSGFTSFPSVKTKIYKMPFGTCLIISPFNFPVLLSLGVLAAAISGGNTAILKMSSKSSYTTSVLINLLENTFPREYICGIDGGHDIADICLKERFDKIFYTGSPNVGKHVMEEASKNLTPVALELGGENGNWAVIRKDANLKDAARKIAFFKICNSGQICININQVAVSKEIAPLFLDELKRAIIEQIGENYINNEEYPKLINKSAFDRCFNESQQYKDRIIFGGIGDPNTLKFSPTIIYPVNIDEPICLHELFSPLLPIVPFDDNDIGTLMNTIASREHGLALYLFTKDIAWAKKEMQRQQFGGGCINEVVMHMTVKGAPFGGVGHSGMGCYHGEWGFREFTHPCTVLIGKTRFNLPLRNHPYNKNHKKLKKQILEKLMSAN